MAHELEPAPRHKNPEGAPPVAPRVFLSYSRKDDAMFVERVYRDLSREGFLVWWDTEAMQSRERTFLQEVRDALEESDRVIAVIGPNAVISRNVRYEWEYAHMFSKGIVPILRQGPDELVPPELRLFHRMDFRDDSRYADTLGQLVRILKVPVPELAPFRATPSLPAYFLSRGQDTSSVIDFLTADVRGTAAVDVHDHVVALIGMPGVGKSVLAAAVARAIDIRRSFSDGIVWLRLGQTPDVLQKIHDVRMALDGPIRPHETIDVAQSKLQEILQHKTSLIVADDVWDVRHVEPLLGALGPRCRLLLTTRDATIASSARVHAHPVNIVTDEEALELLAAWTHDRFEREAARRVAAEVGNLPWALALCGITIGDGVSWRDLADALRSEDLAFLDRQLPNYPHAGILKSLQVSVDFLRQANPSAIERYLELAVFPADVPVPEAAILRLWCHKSALVERTARLILVLLQHKGFIRLEGKEPNRQMTMHSLQYDYLMSQISDRTSMHDRLLQAYGATVEEWTTVPDDGYFYESAAKHLVGAGRDRELCALIEDARWFARKRSLDPYLYSYLDDVTVALHSAAEADPVDFPRMVAYTWLQTVVQSLSIQEPFEIIESLVLLGRPDQALRSTQTIADLNSQVWAERRLVGIFLSVGDARHAKEAGERLLGRVARLDSDLARKLTGSTPPLSETLAALARRQQGQSTTTLRRLGEYYKAIVPQNLDPDRGFVWLTSTEYDARTYRLSVSLGALTDWMLTQVDFPQAAHPDSTENEKTVEEMLPILSTTMGVQRLDKDLLHAAAAEALTEMGDPERGLLLAADLTNALSRLNVMALSLATFMRRKDSETVAALWPALAEMSTERYAGATPERVQMLARVADATLHTDIAVQAMRKAHSLLVMPGLQEAVEAGREFDETLRRELLTRQAHDLAVEDAFGGRKGSARIEARCFLAEKIVHDVEHSDDPRARELMETARKHVQVSQAELEGEMQDVDRVMAMCAVARGRRALGDLADSHLLLLHAERLAAALEGSARVRATAKLASTLATIGERTRGEEVFAAALQQRREHVDTGFVSKFYSHWIKALIATGEIHQALEMARDVSDAKERHSMMGEVAFSLAVSGSADLGVGVADELRSKESGAEATLDSRTLARLAVPYALTNRAELAASLVAEAVAAVLKGAESARIEEAIEILKTLEGARLHDLAFKLCDRTEDKGVRAILFAAMLRELLGATDITDTAFADVFVRAIFATAEIDHPTYHSVIAILMAAGALEARSARSDMRAVVRARTGLALGGAVPAQDEAALNDAMTVEAVTARGLGMLSDVARQDGEMGTLRAINALRIAAGLDRIPLQAFKETDPSKMWELLKLQATGTLTHRRADDPVLKRVLEMNQGGDTSWLTDDLERVVGDLVERKEGRTTWERIQRVAALFAPASGMPSCP